MSKLLPHPTRLLLLSFIFVFSLNIRQSNAAWFDNLPYKVEQPDGTSIECFASGDEFYNWLHDVNGFTIIPADDGYFYYGMLEGEFVVPSAYRVNSVDPAKKGLTPWAKLSEQEYQKRREAFWIGADKSIKAPHTGTLNSLTVYIRFSDQVEFTVNRQVYDGRFNNASGVSLKNYFHEVSYEKLLIESHHYPICALTTNLSYVDQFPRSYYQPYNVTTNPDGYSGDTQRRQREHTLLRNAINAIAAEVPQSLAIDGDNDGNVDNVCFIIRGNSGAWADLLWAHRWVLSSFQVFIHGKRVYDYTFQPENQNDVKTLCHEMFHVLSAPDLYHYTSNGITPAGPWDLMESGFGHMLGFMKFKYANKKWITDMPQITTPGTYTLNPITLPTNNIFKIASPNSLTEYFVVEYRRNIGTYESSLPGSGLLVYRINPAVNGNAQGPPDEVYIYRPNGTLTANGSVNSANYSFNVNRTAINDATDPSSFLQNGSPGGLRISEISSIGATISFKVSFGLDAIAKFEANHTTVSQGGTVTFNNQSSNANTWEWKFPGGTPEASSTQNPVVTYANIGIYPVSLKVTNQYHTDSIYLDNYIIVGSPSISVSPASIEITIPTNSTNQETFEISSTGNTWLRYFISHKFLSTSVNTGIKQAGTILGTYANTISSKMGMVVADGLLYVVSASTPKVSVYDTLTRAVINSYDIHANPSGIAWDGEKLWIGNNVGWVYAYTAEGLPTGDSFQLPGTGIYTLTWDGGAFLVNFFLPVNPTIYRISNEGVILRTFSTNLGSKITQLCWVPQHTDAQLWAMGTGKVYRLRAVDNTFDVVSNFSTLSSIAYSLAHDGTDLWWSTTSGMLYKIDDGLLEWLSMNHRNYLLQQGSTIGVQVSFNSKSLQPGAYQAEIEIMNNDASNPKVIIPVTLNVSQPTGTAIVAPMLFVVFSNHGKLYIQLPESERTKIEIYDVAGRLIKSMENSGNSTTEIDGLKPSNIYILKLSNHQMVETRKVVIR
ncbi:MAG: M6 family metalloprotease domain-containing protein [Bacteroidales bacterium]|nr:M6 family metalloprotease domain-containing protein [Bacteroidales bacterium]MDZ4203358.1 M6 family metalloprotease domain-containing protein [Bacteroidales bacterium]